jgi:hypothetical protein
VSWDSAHRYPKWNFEQSLSTTFGHLPDALAPTAYGGSYDPP